MRLRTRQTAGKIPLRSFLQKPYEEGPARTDAGTSSGGSREKASFSCSEPQPEVDEPLAQKAHASPLRILAGASGALLAFSPITLC
jgi:hypothetical protein